MAKTDRKIDVFSLIIGVLLSLVAQGIFEVVFYYGTGRILEQLVTLIIVFMVAILLVAFILGYFIYGMIKKSEKPEANSQDKNKTNERAKTENGEDKILELARWIDGNESKIFKLFDVYRGWGFILAVLIIGTFTFNFFLVAAGASNIDRIAIGWSGLAVLLAVFALIIQTAEGNIVEARFKRAKDFKKATDSREFDVKEKVFVKALIKMRCRNDEFDLEQVYQMNKDMFTPKKLLETLYK